MNVLLIGSGGREHALAYKIAQSKKLERLFISPGNPGTKLLGSNIKINLEDKNELLNFCKENAIELIVIGPEKPLVEGVSDILREAGYKVFGPGSKAAQIEASKIFAKNIMKNNSIPTANYCEFTEEQYEDAKKYLKKSSFPIVLKADGLAAGKGVLIINNFNEAVSALDDMFVNKIFGQSGLRLIIEEFMEGEEVSIFAITDGSEYVILPSAQDHKRIGDNDTGKNTGGMGAYSPASIIDEKLLKEIEEKIISPTIKSLNKEGALFIGCLYAGLMITKDGPKVVEFNCRFGDPETQVVLPLLQGDFLELLYSAASEKINKSAVNYSGGSAVCVVAASGGYPDSYIIGNEINGLDEEFDENILIFHAGTKETEGKIITAGGRVLSIVAYQNNMELKSVKKIVYENLSKINFKEIYYRNDIADKGIQKN